MNGKVYCILSQKTRTDEHFFQVNGKRFKLVIKIIQIKVFPPHSPLGPPLGPPLSPLPSLETHIFTLCLLSELSLVNSLDMIFQLVSTGELLFTGTCETLVDIFVVSPEYTFSIEL